ncbi:MAG TPA: hypothetical protein VGN03_04470 [Steroidobacteraceae bacterium]|jgi:hypothetical protein
MENIGTYLANEAHVVDWQLARAAAAIQYDAESREVREQIKLLEARAMGLLRAAVTNPGAAAAQRSLVSLETQLARLRADLAWLRADTRHA